MGPVVRSAPLISSKVKDKLPRLASPINKKKEHYLVCLFGFWRPHIQHLVILLQPTHCLTEKDAITEWDLEQKGTSQQVQRVLQSCHFSLTIYTPYGIRGVKGMEILVKMRIVYCMGFLFLKNRLESYWVVTSLPMKILGIIKKPLCLVNFTHCTVLLMAFCF